MKKFLMCMLGTALASGMAFAQQETAQEQEEAMEYGEEVGQQTEEWEEQQDPTTPTHPESHDPTQSTTGTEEPTLTGQESTYGEETGMHESVADMSAEELQGMTIVTESGEEVGEIAQVGHSDQHQERVVTVDVGGFLGIAAKTIAIPVSELQMGSDGNIQTTLSKESIQSQEELDEQSFTAEDSEDTGY